MVVDTSVKYICLLNWMLNHIRTATQSDYLVVLGQHLAVSPKLFNAPDGHTLWMTISMVMFGCFLAFMISVSEFLLLSHTSSLTLSISGIFKVSSNSHDYNSYKTVFKYVLCPFSRKANPLTRSCLDPYMSHLFYFSFWTLFDIYCFPNWSPVGPGGGGGTPCNGLYGEESGNVLFLWLIDDLQQLKGMQSSKQDLWKRYHLSIEGMQKRHLFCEKWYIKG